jgi:zinc protease
MKILLASCLIFSSVTGVFATDAGTAEPKQDFRATVPAPGPVEKYVPPTVATDQLASGLRIALAEVPRYMIVTTKIVFPFAGSARDPKSKAGLASIATAMLNEGTRGKPGLDYLEAVENAGAGISISAGEDAAVVTIVSNVETIGDAFKLAAEMLREPQFAFPVAPADKDKPHNPETRLASIKDRAAIGLQQAARSTKGQVERNVIESVLGDHPYATVPDAASVNAISMSDVKRFHSERMQPYAIAAAGDIDMETLKREAEKHFGSFSVADLQQVPAGLTDVPTVAAKPVIGPLAAGGFKQTPDQWSIRLIDVKGSRRAEIMVGLPMLPRNHPDYVKFQVLRYMFGAGGMSRLNQRLRVKEGWAYFGHGYTETFKHGGVLIAYTNAQPDAAGPAILAIGEEISGMINGPEVPAAGDCAQNPGSEICTKWQTWKDEMERQKQFVSGHLLRGQGNYDSLAESIADSIVKGLPEDTVIKYINEMNAVTLEEVLEMGRHYLRREKLHVAVAGDAFSPVHDTQGQVLPDTPTIYQQLSAVAPVKVLDTEGNEVQPPVADDAS